MDARTISKYIEATAQLIGADKLAEILTEPAKIDAAIKHVLLPDPSRTPEKDISDAALLRSEYRAVRFDYRNREFDDLLAWCNSDTPYAWRLVHGETGRGKTRLLVELCAHLNGYSTGNHWIAGFVKVERFQDDLEAYDVLFATSKPLLIVLDYAERQSAIVTELLRRSRQRGLDNPRTTTRIVLVARRRSEVWEQIFRHDEELSKLKRSSLEDMHLCAVTEAHDIDEVFRAAFADFSAHFGTQHATLEIDFSLLTKGGANPDIGIVHMLALLAVLAPHELDRRTNSRPTQDQVLDFLLDREKRHWVKAARGLNLPAELCQENVLLEVTSLLTLASQQGAIVDAAEARGVLRLGRLLGGQTEALLDRLVTVFRETYPGLGYVNGVTPDLLGDYLILRHAVG